MLAGEKKFHVILQNVRTCREHLPTRELTDCTWRDQGIANVSIRGRSSGELSVLLLMTIASIVQNHQLTVYRGSVLESVDLSDDRATHGTPV